MTDGLPPQPRCPMCGGEYFFSPHVDFDRDTIAHGCQKCGITELDKDGALCLVMGVRIARPPGVGVAEFNRQIRAIEETVRVNCQAVNDYWEKRKP